MPYLYSDEDFLQMAGNIFHLSNLFFQFAHVFMDLLLQNTQCDSYDVWQLF